MPRLGRKLWVEEFIAQSDALDRLERTVARRRRSSCSSAIGRDARRARTEVRACVRRRRFTFQDPATCFFRLTTGLYAQPQARLPHAVQDALRHRRRRSSRWRSGSARTRRSSRCSTRCCCGRCRCRSPTGWSTSAAPGPKPGSQLVQPGGRLRRGLQLPDVPRPREGADGLHRASPRTGIFGANLAYEGQTLSGDGHAGLGQLLPACSACSRRSAGCSARATTAPSASRTSSCSATRYWQTRFGSDPGVLERDADRQRPDDDDRRRRAARASTARRSARGREVFVPITMRGADGARLQRVRQPPQLLGLPLRAAASRASRSSRRSAAINAPYRAIINDVEAPLQTGMSEQTMARFRAKQVDARRRARAGRARCAREAQGAADAAARRHRLRAAHRVREHRQPAAGARGGARRRDGGAAVDRRQPPAARSRSCSPSRCCSRCSAAPPACSSRDWTLDADRRRCCRPRPPTSIAAVDSTGRCCCSPRRWRSARACSSACSRRCTARVPIWSPTLKGQAGQPSGARGRGAVPHVAGDGADRAVDGAARRGRPVHARACSTSAASISG